MSELKFDEVQPDKAQNWLNVANNDFESLLPLATKEAKSARTAIKERAIFKLFSLGVVTARDDWMYDLDAQTLTDKTRFLIDAYNADREKLGGRGATKTVVDSLNYDIKWTRAVKTALGKNEPLAFDRTQITIANYRPFTRCYLYRDKVLNETGYQTPQIFGYPCRFENPAITIMGDSSGKPYFCLAINSIPDLNFVSPASGGTQTFPLFRFDAEGVRVDNITSWALKQFTSHYAEETGKGKGVRKISKADIFYYCYAVLHNPVYREKYSQNLRRQFPRIPLYTNFWKWVSWGEALIALHIDYETAPAYPLKRVDTPDEKARVAGLAPRPILRVDREAGRVILDSETILHEFPLETWDYKLGNRSAIEWVLDQHKEKKPKDITVREKFNSYRFADFKERVIDLLMRVATVSVETKKITDAMKSSSE